MVRDNLKYSKIQTEVLEKVKIEQIADKDTETVKQFSEYLKKNKKSNKHWNELDTFWPPRLINSYRNDNLVVFFGAGMSMQSGLKSWDDLLKSFPLPSKIKSLDELKNDRSAHPCRSLNRTVFPVK